MDGYILDNENEQCITPDECGCSTDDNYYAVRKIIYLGLIFMLFDYERFNRHMTSIG